MKFFLFLCVILVISQGYVKQNVIHQSGLTGNETLRFALVTKSLYGFQRFTIARESFNTSESPKGSFATFYLYRAQWYSWNPILIYNQVFNNSLVNLDKDLVRGFYTKTYSLFTSIGIYIDFNRTTFEKMFGTDDYFLLIESNSHASQPDPMAVPESKESIYAKVSPEYPSFYIEDINNGRYEYFHPAVWAVAQFFYICVFLLTIAFSQQQPLKSRGLIPYMAVFIQVAMLMPGIKTFVTLEQTYNAKTCFTNYLLEYPLTVITIGMVVIHFFRYVVLLNLNKSKMICTVNTDVNDAKVNVRWYVLVLKASSHWSLSFVTMMLLYVFCMILFLIPSIVGNFTCDNNTDVFTGYIQYAIVGVLIFLIFVIFILDIVTNFHYLRKCQLLQFIKDDIFYFRIEIYLIGFVICCGFFLIQLLMIYVGGVDELTIALLNSFQWHLILTCQNLFPLIITIYNTFYRFIIKKKDKGAVTNYLNIPEFNELFVKFCHQEFSVENISCWNHIQIYKTTKDKKSYAEFMNVLYLNGQMSNLQVNVAHKDITNIKDKMSKDLIDKDLFNDLEISITSNLSDTFHRLMFTREFKVVEAQHSILKQTFGE